MSGAPQVPREQGAARPFEPSPWLLERMVADAMAKCDTDVENEHARREARRDLLVERGLARAVRGRFYDMIQRGGFARAASHTEGA